MTSGLIVDGNMKASRLDAPRWIWASPTGGPEKLDVHPHSVCTRGRDPISVPKGFGAYPAIEIRRPASSKLDTCKLRGLASLPDDQTFADKARIQLRRADT